MEARKMITKLKMVTTWIKQHWKISLLAVWSIVVWLVSRKNAQGAIDAMKANKESYESQIAALKEQHKIEKEKLEQLNLKYQETIATIEKKYDVKEKELSKEKKKRVKEIVEKAKDNPDEINEKIESLFGFTSDS
jgi:flagellar motility protein MotE (MotC chaperone)